jgi:hypothetical protein
MAIDPNEAAQAWMLLDSILKNPDTRTDTLKLLKKWNPKAAIPEIDAAAPYEKKISDLSERLDKALESISNEKVDGKLASQFDALRTKRGYTDEGMEKIKQLMISEAIANPNVAADHFDAQQPKADPALPSGYFPSTFIDESDKGTERWFQNEDAAADAEIMTILREARDGQVH